MIISKIVDRYTYLHFAAGIIAYYWGFTLIEWIAVHVLLDIFQRTDLGKKVTKLVVLANNRDILTYLKLNYSLNILVIINLITIYII